MQKYWYCLAPLLALLGLAALYWPVNSLGYVWDDTVLFQDSPLLRNPENIWVSISTQLLPGTNYFRPAVLLTFIAEFKLFGVQASVSHAVAYALFLINCSLVGLLAWRLCRHHSTASRVLRVALAILVYGCNPVLLESAAWVSGRFDLMVTTFVLLGCVALSCTQGIARCFLVALCFLLALCSKEMAVTFPLIAVVWLWMERPQVSGIQQRFYMLLERENLLLCFFIAVIGVAYLATRYALYSGFYASDSLFEQSSFFVRLAYVGQTAWFYIHMAVWPFADLSPIHPFDPLKMSLAQEVAGVLIVVVLITLCALLLIRGRQAGLLVLCALVTLLPVINIIPLLISGNIGQERFLTLPVAFLSLALVQLVIPAHAISEAMQRTLPWLLALLGGVWLILGGMNIYLNAPLWGSQESLWAWAYEKAPNTESVQFNYVASLLFQQGADKAELALQKVEKLPQGLSGRMKGLKGQLLVRQEKYEEGLHWLDEGLVGEFQPHEQVLSKGMDLDKASIVLNGYPSSWYIRFIYGAKAEAYVYLGQYENAERSLQVMAFYDPSYAAVPLYRSFSAYAQGNFAEADSLFEKALSMYVESKRTSVYAARADFVLRLCRLRPAGAVCQDKQRFLSVREG